MVSPSAFNVKPRRRKPCDTKAGPDAIPALCHADPAKALAMESINRLVADGLAQWDMLAGGDIQLRFNTGETFLLAERVIVRLV